MAEGFLWDWCSISKTTGRTQSKIKAPRHQGSEGENKGGMVKGLLALPPPPEDTTGRRKKRPMIFFVKGARSRRHPSREWGRKTAKKKKKEINTKKNENTNWSPTRTAKGTS